MKTIIKNKVDKHFYIAAAVFTIAALIANLAAVKQFSLPFGFIAPAGVLVFPITYILSDVVAEVYGFKPAKNVALVSIGINITFTGILWGMVYLPYPSYYDNKSFSVIFSQAPRIALAGFIALLIGQFVNAWVMDHFHMMDAESKFGLRAVLSTVFGELTDSLIFLHIAFAFVMPEKVILTMVVTQVLIKVGYELIMLPITKKIVDWFKQNGELLDN